MKKLSQAFDFQRFQNNPRLASILSDVESRYANVIADEDLDMVHAAGVITSDRGDDLLFNQLLPPPEKKP